MTDQLDLSKTYCAILDATRNRGFISYGDLAKANDANWQSVWREMSRRLGDLVEIVAQRDWPIAYRSVSRPRTQQLLLSWRLLSA